MVHARGGAPARARLLAVALVLLLPHAPRCFCTPLDPSKTYSEGVALVRAWQVARYTPVRLAPHEPPPRRLRVPLLSHAREWMLELEAVGGVWAREAHVSWSRAVQGGGGGGLESAPWAGGREYAGRVAGEPGSRVIAVLGRDGLLDATILLPSGAQYHLEPLHRHLHAPYNYSSPEHSPEHSHLHSLMYRARDVLPPDAPCPHSTALHSVPRVRRPRAAPPSPPELPLDLAAPYATSAPSPSSPRPRPRPRPRLHVDRSQLVVASAPPPPSSPPQPPRRPMDEEADEEGGGERTACMLYLQADHLLWERLGGVEETLAVLARHVLVLNDIYSRTDFDGDGRPDNITFLIKRAHVHTRDALHDPHYRYPHNYGVEKFLELFSEEDYDAFCLAYMFTYRDFELGTLGLAWTGDLKNAGGVCERNGHYRGSMKSLNTGIVTLLNYGKHVPAAVSHVTLAHEIGHNFGSPHDPEECTPYGEQGNFIMFARATAGDKPNNNKFSACSMRAIRPVLAGKARPPAPHACFTRPQRAVCGNGVVEEGEQCDCGWAGECRDPCCRPMSTRSTAGGHGQHPGQAHAAPCTLAPRAACSPSQGPCCAPDCRLRFATQCRADNGCREPAYCDGARPACPPSRHKPNRTVCDDSRLCYMGECTGSLCLAYGLEPCQCEVRADRPRSACELCCREPAAPEPAGGGAGSGGGGACVSTWERADMTGAWAGAGAPCDHYRGYCDVFQVCRALDPQGPLATLRRLLQEPSRLLAALRHHWYAWALALCGAGALLAWCARPPAPHGAAAAAARKADPKLRAPVTQVHTTTAAAATPAHLHLIVHQPVRSKLPFKKKVALRTRTRKAAAVSSAAPTAAAPAAVATPTAAAPAAVAPAAAAPVSKPAKGSGGAGGASGGGRRVRLQLVYSPPFRLRVRVRRDRDRVSGAAPAPVAAAGAAGGRSRRAPAAQRRTAAGHRHARRRHSEPQPPAPAPANPPAAAVDAPDGADATAAVASPRLQRSQSACVSAPLAPPGTPERASLTPGAPS